MKNERRYQLAQDSVPVFTGYSSPDIQPAFREWILQTPGIYLLLRSEDLIIDLVNTALLIDWHRDVSIVGQPFGIVFPELRGQRLLTTIRAVFDTGIAVYRHPEQLLTRRDGIDAFFLLPIRLPPGMPARWHAMGSECPWIRSKRG